MIIVSFIWIWTSWGWRKRMLQPRSCLPLCALYSDGIFIVVTCCLIIRRNNWSFHRSKGSNMMYGAWLIYRFSSMAVLINWPISLLFRKDSHPRKLQKKTNNIVFACNMNISVHPNKEKNCWRRTWRNLIRYYLWDIQPKMIRIIGHGIKKITSNMHCCWL